MRSREAATGTWTNTIGDTSGKKTAVPRTRKRKPRTMPSGMTGTAMNVPVGLSFSTPRLSAWPSAVLCIGSCATAPIPSTGTCTTTACMPTPIRAAGIGLRLTRGHGLGAGGFTGLIGAGTSAGTAIGTGGRTIGIVPIGAAIITVGIRPGLSSVPV